MEEQQQEQQTRPTSRAKLYGALAKAQAEFKPIKKSAKVTIRTKDKGSYEYHYAPLDEIIAATTEALSKHGLAQFQTIEGNVLTTVLAHESGEVIESRMTLGATKDWKEFGGSLTYARRYSLGPILGVAAEEDKDTQIMDRAARPPAQRKQQQRQAPPKRREPPPKREETPPQRQEAPPQREETPPQPEPQPDAKERVELKKEFTRVWREDRQKAIELLKGVGVIQLGAVPADKVGELLEKLRKP